MLGRQRRRALRLRPGRAGAAGRHGRARRSTRSGNRSSMLPENPNEALLGSVGQARRDRGMSDPYGGDSGAPAPAGPGPSAVTPASDPGNGRTPASPRSCSTTRCPASGGSRSTGPRSATPSTTRCGGELLRRAARGRRRRRGAGDDRPRRRQLLLGRLRAGRRQRGRASTPYFTAGRRGPLAPARDRGVDGDLGPGQAGHRPGPRLLPGRRQRAGHRLRPGLRGRGRPDRLPGGALRRARHAVPRLVHGHAQRPWR